MAEHSAVNRRVVGSSPTCGAKSMTNWGGSVAVPFFRFLDMEMFWVYVLENSRGKFYLGQTEDIVKRFQDRTHLLSVNPDESGL